MADTAVYLNLGRTPLRAEVIAGLSRRLEARGIGRAYVYLGALFPWRVGAFPTCADTYDEAVVDALFQGQNVRPWLPVVFRSALSPMRGAPGRWEQFPLSPDAVEHYGSAFVKLVADAVEDIEPFLLSSRVITLDSPLPRADGIDPAVYGKWVLEPLVAEIRRLDMALASHLSDVVAAGAQMESGPGPAGTGASRAVAGTGLAAELADIMVLLDADQRRCVLEFDACLDGLWGEVRRIKEAEYLGRYRGRERCAQRVVEQTLAGCEAPAECLSSIAPPERIYGVATSLVGAAEEAMVLAEHRGRHHI